MESTQNTLVQTPAEHTSGPLLRALASVLSLGDDTHTLSLQGLIQRLGPMLHVSRCDLYFHNSSGELKQVGTWVGDQPEGDYPRLREARLWPELDPVRSGEVVVVSKESVAADRAKWYEREGITALIAIPIMAGATFDGVLFLERTDGVPSEEQLALYQLLAGGLSSLKGTMEMHRLLRERDEQLQYLQRMEALGAMAGGVAHDFNNLLMAMMGNVSILLHERERDNPEYMRLESIRQYIVSGSKLTKQLLGFAQGDSYAALPIDLNWIITDMIKMFGRTHKELKIKSFLEKNLWAVVADTAQVEQVLMNLLVNASQALSGGGTIEILTRNIDISENQASLYLAASGRYVEIVVKDDGEGMAREVLDRIFEPFFSTRGSESSSGLGLSAVYGIVKNHGGFINVSSEPGRGSSFFVYFPASNERARRLSRPTGEVIRGSETVLLVDDEEIILKTAGSMLAKLGYKVILAESGREAVLRAREMGDAIDLVIMDMIMPEMDGVATFREMRRIIPSMKILLSSGYSFGEDAHRLMESGSVGFIQKPFDIKELSLKVRDVLEKVSAPSSP